MSAISLYLLLHPSTVSLTLLLGLYNSHTVGIWSLMILCCGSIGASLSRLQYSQALPNWNTRSTSFHLTLVTMTRNLSIKYLSSVFWQWRRGWQKDPTGDVCLWQPKLTLSPKDTATEKSSPKRSTCVSYFPKNENSCTSWRPFQLWRAPGDLKHGMCWFVSCVS